MHQLPILGRKNALAKKIKVTIQRKLRVLESHCNQLTSSSQFYEHNELILDWTVSPIDFNNTYTTPKLLCIAPCKCVAVLFDLLLKNQIIVKVISSRYIYKQKFVSYKFSSVSSILHLSAFLPGAESASLPGVPDVTSSHPGNAVDPWEAREWIFGGVSVVPHP